jgi:hypothetical protein
MGYAGYGDGVRGSRAGTPDEYAELEWESESSAGGFWSDLLDVDADGEDEIIIYSYEYVQILDANTYQQEWMSPRHTIPPNSGSCWFLLEDLDKDAAVEIIAFSTSSMSTMGPLTLWSGILQTFGRAFSHGQCTVRIWRGMVTKR